MTQTTTDEQQLTEPPPGVRVGRWPRMHVAAVAVAAVLIAGTALVAQGATSGQRSTFVDDFHRQCTQVEKGAALALSCAPAPFEDRLAEGLRTASQRANGGTP